jgi:hypothetical protein
VLGVWATAFVLVARAEAPFPVKVDAKKSATERPDQGDPKLLIEDAANQQERLKRQFDDFKQSLLRLAQRLENSPKQEDKDKSKNLKEAIKKASEEGVDSKFGTLVDILRKENLAKDLDQMKVVLEQNEELRRDIRAIMELLLKDDRDSQLRKEIERTARLLEELKRVIHKQELVKAKVEMNRGKPKDHVESQKRVTGDTKRLIDPNAKNNRGAEAKKGEGKDSKSGKAGIGEPKDDTKDPKGESRQAGKEGKAGDGKESKEGKDGKAGEGKDGKEGKEGKDGAGKEGEGKGGEGKDGKSGEGKEGKGGEGKEGKSGEGKDGKGGEGKDGKSGEGKEGKPGAGKEGEGKPNAGKPGAGQPNAGKPTAAKPGAGKPGEGKSGDSKGKGEGKGTAKGGKPGEGKGEGKSGGQSGQQGQQGQAKSDQQGGQQGGQQGSQQAGQQPPQDSPIKKQIQDANHYQKIAENELDKNKKKEATDNQENALEKLRAAQKKLEDLLKQLREEEIERLLAALQARCQHMLALQIAVRDGTVDLDKVIQGNPDQKPTRADDQASLGLADKEEDIVKEAKAALRLIEAEGSAVAFAEVFQQVLTDMINVHGRLRKTDVGVVTVTIENDIIATLKEMIEALKKARQDNQSKGGKPGQGGMPQDQRLIDLIAELKMIRSMQLRVNARTEVYGKQYEGEQAPPPLAAKDDKQREHYEMIQRELKDLAGRQEKIGKVTHDIATGKNEAK